MTSCAPMCVFQRPLTGKEEMRARDLFYALWIPDLFMQVLYTNGVPGVMHAVSHSARVPNSFARIYALLRASVSRLMESGACSAQMKRLGSQMLWAKTSSGCTSGA
jgi:hypothetical protein